MPRGGEEEDFDLEDILFNDFSYEDDRDQGRNDFYLLERDESVVLGRSDILVNHEANSREYRGEVLIEGAGNKNVFVGVTHWGASGKCGSMSKEQYRGDSLYDAVNAVNRMLIKKIAKGYKASGAGEVVYREALEEASRLGASHPVQ